MIIEYVPTALVTAYVAAAATKIVITVRAGRYVVNRIVDHEFRKTGKRASLLTKTLMMAYFSVPAITLSTVCLPYMVFKEGWSFFRDDTFDELDRLID